MMMHDEKPRDAAPNPETVRDETEAAAPAQAPQGEPDPFQVLEALNAENASLKDRLLRALADTENMRRRSERDVADARSYAVTSFARDMLTVVDNLRRALDSLPAEARASAAAQGGFKSFIDGIELTERDLLSTLGRFGVKKLEPLGQKFDPNVHQAMFEVPDDAVPSGTVKQVVQPGFTIQERVLRPALVGVSKIAKAPEAANTNGRVAGA